jgi:hypothetical protein
MLDIGEGGEYKGEANEEEEEDEEDEEDEPSSDLVLIIIVK